jgi:chorismate dehydratase
LEQFVPGARVVVDLPSRLADELSAGRFDVALIPSIEFFRHPGYTIVSDACIACEGPVKSVMLYSRVPMPQIRTLALDEGSRTSAALVRIMLCERFGLKPEIQPLPIGSSAEESSADAILLIGDRGIVEPDGRFHSAWDLGEQWLQWTGLPFVFAMWIARPGLELDALDTAFSLARDEGVNRIDAIARREAPCLGISEEQCRAYLRDHLRFRLGPRERQGLERYSQLAVAHGLASRG